MILRSVLMVLLLAVLACQVPQPCWAQDNREIRPSSQMSGTIVAPVDEGKQALSGGDRILVYLAGEARFKAGDFLEIYQPVAARDQKAEDPLLKKVGLAVMLEKVKDRLLLCVIDTSVHEVAVGDWVYVIEHK